MKKNPILYPADESDFTTNGVGVLHDAIRCRVTEELNGLYELEMTYPANGDLINEIAERSIIYAESSDDEGMQPFRVYRIVKSLTGNILIYAQHISYDLSGIPVSPFHLGDDWDYEGTAEAAFEEIKDKSVVTNPFTFTTNVTGLKEMESKVPMSARALLLGSEPSIVSIFGGDFKFDGFDVHHLQRRGTDRGFTIRYGVNMTSLNQDEDVEPLYTGIYPYYSDNDGTIEIDGKIIESPDAHGFDRIKVVDLTSEFSEAPWYPADVEAKAREWLEKNGFGLPQISLDVGFAQLRKSEEYKDLRILEEVNLGDTVHVFFEKIGVSSMARVTKTVWDALEHRYVSIHLGDASKSISTTISNMQKSSVAEVTASEKRAKEREAYIKELNDVISSGLGMHKVIYQGKTYYSDAADLNDATYIITMNSGGFAYTHDWNNGDPTWEGGLDRDGNMVINRLSALKIQAEQIEVGALTAENITAAEVINAPTGKLDVFSSESISTDDITINGQNECKFKYIVSAGQEKTISFSSSATVWKARDNSFVVIHVAAEENVPEQTTITFTFYGTSDVIGNFVLTGFAVFEENTTQATIYNERFEPVYLGFSIGGRVSVAKVFTIPSYRKYDIGGGEYGVGINSSFMPYGNTSCDLGKANNKWDNIYANTGTIITSDRRQKNTIEKLPEKYSAMFDRLNPVRFKTNNGTSNRFHAGLIAQDVEEAMNKADISGKEFAGLTKSENKTDGSVSYGLRYEEFIPLCIDQIQKLKRRIEELEAKHEEETI